MLRRMRFELIVLALLIGVLVGQATRTLARQYTSYDFFDTLVDVHGELVKHYVTQPDHKTMMLGAIHGMIEPLKDPYTDFLTTEDLEQFDKHTRASFSGIGAEISRQDGQLVIVTPLEDSPAFEAGIMAGDIILAIDGESTEGFSTLDAVKRISGEAGTNVTLRVRHADGREQRITIVRQKINIQTVKGVRRDADHHWQFMLDRQAGIGYVRLTQFAEPTLDALRQALATMKRQKLRGLILDLRFNPGGLLDQARDIADLFLSEGLIVSTRGRNSPERSWSAGPDNDVGDFPMIVLINEASASASEIVSGALKDNDRAIIVGTRSYGKGSVQQIIALPGGTGAIKLTTAYYYLPSGRNIHRRDDAEVWGVDPTEGYYVPMDLEQVRRMNEIRRASDIIGNGNGTDREHAVAWPEHVTPQWLREKRSDPQLAAALQTMLDRLNEGRFKPVGQSNATLLAHLSEQASLRRTRDAIQKRLDEINKELRQLNAKVAEQSPDAKVDRGHADADADAANHTTNDADVAEPEPATP